MLLFLRECKEIYFAKPQYVYEKKRPGALLVTFFTDNFSPEVIRFAPWFNLILQSLIIFTCSFFSNQR